MMGKVIRFEQAVYGNFPFWSRGYGLLARSSGCRPDWLEGLTSACRRFGERPAGVAEAEGLFALPLRRGPWMIVAVIPLGCDDLGRPGALAFHALFVTPRDYRKAGACPFAFAPSFRRDWSELDCNANLRSGSLNIDPLVRVAVPPIDEETGAIVDALAEGRRVLVQSNGPIDELSRKVWKALPARLRRRTSVATWAFDNANEFDLVGLPHLAGLQIGPLDLVRAHGVDLEKGTCLGLEPGLNPPDPSGPMKSGRSRIRAGMRAGLVAVGLAVVALAMILVYIARPGLPLTPAEADPGSPFTVPSMRPSKDVVIPEFGDGRPLSTGERERLGEALVDMTERFGPPGDPSKPSEAGELDPATLMIGLSRGLIYTGPWLSASDVERLRRIEGPFPESRSGPDPPVLKWHELIRRFAGDRPLPEGFARGSVRRQLATLAWSFHVEREPGVVQALAHGSAEEVVHALSDALSVDVPLPATSLESTFPVLERYRLFLDRLPRR